MLREHLERSVSSVMVTMTLTTSSPDPLKLKYDGRDSLCRFFLLKEVNLLASQLCWQPFSQRKAASKERSRPRPKCCPAPATVVFEDILIRQRERLRRKYKRTPRCNAIGCRRSAVRDGFCLDYRA